MIDIEIEDAAGRRARLRLREVDFAKWKRSGCRPGARGRIVVLRALDRLLAADCATPTRG